MGKFGELHTIFSPGLYVSVVLSKVCTIPNVGNISLFEII